MDSLDWLALTRMGLIFGHVLALLLAAAAMTLCEHAIFGRRRIHLKQLQLAAQGVVLALALLWLTGLAVIGLDTGFQPSLLLAKPKLMAKLTVVTLLSLNGWALHRLAFPRFSQVQTQPMQAALLPALLGAVSAATWLFAAFVGVGHAATKALGYGGFMAAYGLCLLLACVAALHWGRPMLARRLQAGPRTADTQAGALLPA
ncbi:hypothetical protein HNQ51_000445 [Inhella inkyongensis]|uniref:DUF2214 family protein n=1 Tax=Inhella inkyongensis TaxID=392593 RepID=A0A840S0W0_9BURK|nr:hypothetical protein [Inhella inkyongensis]MBB5203152.1 hypothetical protein [Inhella inkyongensis]